jgi:hypothetical protein
MDDVREWQQRPLDDVYPVIFLDALVLKIREGGTVQRRACYLALGVSVEGERDVLGMWFQETGGAKYWMQVLSELKQRGVSDILVCCVDGLKGFPEAIEAIYPQTVDRLRGQPCLGRDASVKRVRLLVALGFADVEDPTRRRRLKSQRRRQHGRAPNSAGVERRAARPLHGGD